MINSHCIVDCSTHHLSYCQYYNCMDPSLQPFKRRYLHSIYLLRAGGQTCRMGSSAEVSVYNLFLSLGMYELLGTISFPGYFD